MDKSLLNTKEIKRIIFKTFFYILFSLVSIISAIIIILQFSFPSDTVRDKIISYLKKNYKVELEIKDLNFSLFNGISLDGVNIKNDLSEKIPILKFNNFIIDYDLLAYIVDRKIILNKISLDSPIISLMKTSSEENWNYESLVNKFIGNNSNNNEIRDEDNGSDELKIDFNMKEFRLSNVDLLYDDGSQIIEISGFNLLIDKIFFKDLENYSAKLNILLGNKEKETKNIVYTDEYNNLSSSFTFNIDISVDINKDNTKKSLDLVKMKFITEINNLFLVQNPIEDKDKLLNISDIDETNNNYFDMFLNFEASFNEFSDSLFVDDFIFKISNMLEFNSNLYLKNVLDTKQDILLGLDSTNLAFDIQNIYNLTDKLNLKKMLAIDELDLDFKNSSIIILCFPTPVII